MKNPKARLRRKADKLWFERLLKPRCEICNKPSKQVHHFFSKSAFGHLRYDLDNGISLCNGCHFKLHHQNPTIVQDIIEKRGMEWYNNLKKQAHNPPKDYKITIGWYKEEIAKLL